MSGALDRALGLLAALAERSATLDELAAATAVHKTTVMRQLHTLEKQRFVVRDDHQRYRLGPRFFELSFKALEQRDLRTTAHQHLAELNAKTGHTVHLAAFEGREVVYIDKFESRYAVRMYSRVGLTAALHATAVAKVLLADLPPDRQRSITAELSYPKLTENTLTTEADLLDQLEQVRRQGWALDDAEHEPFVHCVAVPIREAGGRVVAAASITAPIVTLSHDALMGLLPDLRTAADAISVDLGSTLSERTTP